MTDTRFVLPSEWAGAATGVVAIGRNEGERLRRCLASIPQSVPIVYVDSQSTDGSLGVAKAHGAYGVALDMSRPFTAARARNAGFEALQAILPGLAYVQFVDGDCEFEPGWIETARAFLDTHPDTAVVCGRRRERYPERSLYNRLCDREWNTPIGKAEACGGDAMFRIADFKAVGGYDPAVVAGEEPELCRRLRANGRAIWRIDAPMTIHDAAMTSFRQYWRRAVRGGFGYAQTWHVRRLYGRELMRAALWAGILPITAIALTLITGSPVWLGLLLLPILQVVRLALRNGGGSDAWRAAGLLMISKFAELQGALRYMTQSWNRYVNPPKSYK